MNYTKYTLPSALDMEVVYSYWEEEQLREMHGIDIAADTIIATYTHYTL